MGFRATGQTVAFDGFLKLYQEGRDDPASDEDEGGLLPPMAPGDPLERGEIMPRQHFTEPPPRFTEASLVRKLEELGIGRPSTYASIISVLQDRDYVRLESKRFVPEDRGRLVSAFLVGLLRPVRAAGVHRRRWRAASTTSPPARCTGRRCCASSGTPFHGTVDEVKERRVADVLEALNELLGPQLFPAREDGGDPRACPLCGDGRLSLKFGRYGAFVGCSNYPECRYTRQLGAKPGNGEDQAEVKERLIGVDPDTHEEVLLRRGPYGPYVQRGAGDSLKRSSLPPRPGAGPGST